MEVGKGPFWWPDLIYGNLMHTLHLVVVRIWINSTWLLGTTVRPDFFWHYLCWAHPRAVRNGVYDARVQPFYNFLFYYLLHVRVKSTLHIPN